MTEFILSAGSLIVATVATDYLKKISRAVENLSGELIKHDERIRRIQGDIHELKEKVDEQGTRRAY